MCIDTAGSFVGGAEVRLGDLTKDTSKEMVNIRGRSLHESIIEWFVDDGVWNEII
jgi:NDP-sugar pyrophosphorylase family protein